MTLAYSICYSRCWQCWGGHTTDGDHSCIASCRRRDLWWSSMASPHRLATTAHAALKTSPRPAPPLLLLHGLLASSATLGTLLRHPDCAPASPKLALDLTGHGRSPHAAARLAYPALAADVAREVERRRWSGVDVAGHSWGGKVAMALALTRPELVRRLVVADIAVRKERGMRQISAFFPPLCVPFLWGGSLADKVVRVPFCCCTTLRSFPYCYSCNSTTNVQ